MLRSHRSPRVLLAFALRVSVVTVVVALLAAPRPLAAQVLPAPGELIGLTSCCPNEVVSIDATSGVTTSLGVLGDATNGFVLTGIVVDSAAGDLYAIRATPGFPDRVVRFELATGVLTESPPLTSSLLQLGFDAASGDLLGLTNCCPRDLVRIDFATAAFDPIATVGTNTSGQLFTPMPVWAGNAAYFIEFDALNGSSRVVSVELASGAVTSGATLGGTVIQFDVDPSSGTLYGLTTCCPNQLVEIEPITGVVTPIGPIPGVGLGFSAFSSPIDPSAGSYDALFNDAGIQRIAAIDLATATAIDGAPLSASLLWAGRVGTALDTFVRGDVNADQSVNIADAVTLLNALFVAGSLPLACEDAADTNDDGVLQITDAIVLLGSLFTPGAPPLAEPSACGVDPSDGDPLHCESFAACP